MAGNSNKEYGQLSSINQKLGSLIEKTDPGDGCCESTLKVTIVDAPTPEYEHEYICLSNDGGDTVVKGISILDTATQTPTVMLADGSSAAGYSIVPCTDEVIDREKIETCMENAAGKWQIVSFINVEDATDVIGPIYINPTGAVATDPGDLVACTDATRTVNMLNNCDGTTETKTVTGENPTQVVLDENQVVKVAIDKSCDVAPTSRNVDINTDCAGTTETVAVKDDFATEVVLKPNQNIEVTIDKSCDTTRDVDMLNNCDGTTEVVTVKDEAASEVIFNENQVLKVAIDKSCDVPVVDRNIDVLDGDCALSTTSTAVNGGIAQEVVVGGTTKVLPMRLIENCEVEVVTDYEYVCNKDTGVYDLHIFTTTDNVPNATPVITATTINCDDDLTEFDEEVYCNGATGTQWIRTVSFAEDGTRTVISDVDSGILCSPAATVKSITKTIDCAGTTASVDTTETVEAVIDQVVDVKQCSKDESISEIEVCASGVTLVKKTKLESDGTENETFYGANGVVVTAPAAYDIGACAAPITQVVQTQDDCAGATSNTTVNSVVSIAGTEKTLNVRIVEDCVPNFDTEYFSGCSDIDGRIILRKVVKNEETGVETITLVEQDGVTAVVDGSVLVACSGADYEKVEQCRHDVANDDYYKVVKFINSSDATDTFDVWIDSDGNTVAPVAGTVSCSFDCTTKMEYERCFDTGSGVVTAQGYYTLDDYTETYQTAQVIASTDPAFVVGADVIASIDSWTLVSCQDSTTIVDRTTTHSRTGGNNTYPANFRSFSITAVSADVTLNGQAMMQGFTVSLDSQENEQHVTDQVVTGTDYFVTYVV